MKKIIAVLLILCMTLCFVGCKNKDKNESAPYEIDINYYLGVGQISEATYRLGLNPDEIEKDAEAQNSGHSHEGGDGHEGIIDYQRFDSKEAYIVDGFYYCFNEGNEEDGIVCIIGNDTIFGFVCGVTSKYEINSAVSDLNPEISKAEDDEFFYMPFSMENIDKLTVKNGNKVLNFYFENDILISASLYNSDKWEF